MPPPFSGRPTPGGQVLPITNPRSAAADRRLAMDAAKRVKFADNAGSLSHRAPRAERRPKSDNFLWRFPEAMRLFK
jgi:hypothetical protein